MGRVIVGRVIVGRVNGNPLINPVSASRKICFCSLQINGLSSYYFISKGTD